jgi:hypothetical protein
LLITKELQLDVLRRQLASVRPLGFPVQQGNWFDSIRFISWLCLCLFTSRLGPTRLHLKPIQLIGIVQVATFLFDAGCLHRENAWTAMVANLSYSEQHTVSSTNISLFIVNVNNTKTTAKQATNNKR